MQNLHKNVVVIVDAYGTGAFIAPYFLAKNYLCMHIATMPKSAPESLLKTYRPVDFFKEINIENQDESMLIEELKKYNIKLIIPGHEYGVIVAEKLAGVFKKPSNDSDKIMARRDKFIMIDTLQKSSVPCAMQRKSSDINDVMLWYKNSGLSKVVLKPPMSACSSGVFLCNSEKDIETAFFSIKKEGDYFGVKNNEIVIQEFLDGKEYIVNSVSSQGVNLVTDIWRGYSEHPHLISKDSYADLIHENSDEYVALSKYLFDVLPALGIKNGAAHAEIKITSKGPRLIEIGSRLPGSIDLSVLTDLFGCTQLQLMAEGLLNHDVFMSMRKFLQGHPCKKFSRYVYFISLIEGKIKKPIDLTCLFLINSVLSVVFNLRKGDVLKKTLENPGRPGYAYLVADSQQQLEDDYQKLRIAELKLYESIL